MQKSAHARIVTTVGIGAAIVLGAADRALKMLAEQPQFAPPTRAGWHYFGFEQFHNPGVAFGVPIPLAFVLPISALLLVLLLLWVRKQMLGGSENVFLIAATSAIIVGALSNAFDRLTYGYTIDYIRVVNGVINIADLLVIAGLLTLLFSKKQH